MQSQQVEELKALLGSWQVVDGQLQVQVEELRIFGSVQVREHAAFSPALAMIWTSKGLLQTHVVKLSVYPEAHVVVGHSQAQVVELRTLNGAVQVVVGH